MFGFATLIDLVSLFHRFPDADLLASFGLLSMRPITFLTEPVLNNWGNDKLEALIEQYSNAKTHTWEDREEKSTTSEPLMVAAATREEWAQAKAVVKAQLYPTDHLATLWKLISKFHGDQFRNLLKLSQLAITLQVHTAGVGL